jgi:hypothetical protein
MTALDPASVPEPLLDPEDEPLLDPEDELLLDPEDEPLLDPEDEPLLDPEDEPLLDPEDELLPESVPASQEPQSCGQVEHVSPWLHRRSPQNLEAALAAWSVEAVSSVEPLGLEEQATMVTVAQAMMDAAVRRETDRFIGPPGVRD